MLIMGVPHLGNNASPHLYDNREKEEIQMCQCTDVPKSKCTDVPKCHFGYPPPYPKLCGVVIIAHYNLYQIVCSPRVADASPICTKRCAIRGLHLVQFLASYANHLAPNASPPSPRKHPTEGRCKYVFVCTKTLLALNQNNSLTTLKFLLCKVPI